MGWFRCTCIELQTGSSINCDSFKAPRVLRAFPFIVSLPFGNIQAQGEIKLRIREIGKDIVKKKIVQLRESQEGIVDDDLLGYLGEVLPNSSYFF